MAMTDPVADMLTRIRNANAQKHSQLDVPASRMKKEIARVLKQANLIKDFAVTGQGAKEVIRIQLRYIRENVPAITGLRRISRPGLRVYVPVEKISAMERGIGMVILSTPKGIMTGSQAKRQKAGGEVLCKVW
jgi:small subunit ribosomal protein S8